MPKVTYIDHTGTERTLEVKSGTTVMENAISQGVPGIDGDCGGACACATCHVYVDPAYLERLPAQGDTEAAMLEFAENVKENSRLGCQITITEELDGLIVRTPESQH